MIQTATPWPIIVGFKRRTGNVDDEVASVMTNVKIDFVFRNHRA